MANLFQAQWQSLLGDLRAEKEGGHINALKFKGTLLVLDEPSTKPPNGSSGHKILIPKEVAQKHIDTLINMGIDYEDTFDKHNPKKKVGVIQKAWIDGNKLMCSGIIWKKDFPDVEDALKDKRLGMSFEGSNISVEDPKADVWKITDVCFTGAAILYKTAAAYYKTEALAAAADTRHCSRLVYIRNGGKAMSQKNASKKQDKSRRSVSAAGGFDENSLAKAIQRALKPQTAALTALTSAVTAMSASFEDFQNEATQNLVVAAKGKGASSSASSSQAAEASSEEAAASSSQAAEADVTAAKKKKGDVAEDSSEEQDSEEAAASSSQQGGAESSAADDAGDLESMDEDGYASSSEVPGHMNKDANTNKGRKTTVTKGKANPKSKMGGVLCSADETKGNKELRKMVRTLAAQVEQLTGKLKKSERKAREIAASAEKAYQHVERRSYQVPSDRLAGLLSKGSIDLGTMSASGEKISVEEFNALLDKCPSLGASERISMKAEATRLGIMDEGRVSR